MSRTRTASLFALCVVGLLWPLRASAHGNNYPFDYDPSLSEDPTGITRDLATLHDALPGLPAGLVEIEMGGIAFDYFPETLDMIQRARDSGPAIAPPVERVARQCALHSSFSVPAILVQPASPSCQAASQAIQEAFAGSFATCQEVEYPEVYVLSHPPGVVDANFLGRSQLLSTLEGQIALIGEALSHLDYPVGLIPDDFLPLARSVIAKIRYQKLRDALDLRLAAYRDADQRLQSSASCFDPAASAGLRSSIAGLITELSAVEQQLIQLYDEGLAQAAQDRLAVERQGRVRNDLPHPALTDHEREMLAFYLAAVYWRMRGGGLIRNPANGSVPDITYVVNIFEGIARFAGGLEDASGVGTRYAIDESYGYAEWWDMGNEPGHDQYYDLLWMTDRGRRGVRLASSMISDLGYDVKDMVAGGLIMGPCYYYMWYELWTRNGRRFQLGEDLQTPYYTFLEMPVSSGEVCYGGAMGLGLARTLLWGRPSDCQPDCSGRVCGGDGCGGSCGECSLPAVCDLGQCVAPEVDAGMSMPEDASTPAPDAGQPSDAGAEDAAPADAAPVDAGSSDVADAPASTGCGCSAADVGGASGLSLVLLLGALGLRRRAAR
ncbi:MAG: hypothetical protein H6730_13315 [Deltaproteobacteria bacterium]|nr:hypothetical protein [Deltaproteobacteria bacterium]